MQAHRIRRQFLDFFVARGHREVASSSLVPVGDPTLLFTNAGMVQFKSVFQGLERRDYRRAATVQKCVRAGGKHNDLEHVGHTPRHHTFFEMLGNFSFGDYFKRQAIEFGWELVTSPEFYGIDPDRIRVTVHYDDDEARRLWREVTGISDRRIYGLGDADNYWQMGDTGPSGPCSEIYVELDRRRGPGPDLTAEEFQAASEAGRFLEIWNLVFMQYDLKADGTRVPLPAPSVDTGAGLERLAAVLQEADSNFHTDLFLPLIRRVEDVVDRPYDRGERGASHRVLADHARAVTFLLADGVHPSNDGRGYVLRRILRRAVRHAWLLGRREPTLSRVADTVIAELDDVYPELRQQADYVRTTVRAEEERFLVTIEDGLRRLDELTAGRTGTIRGEDAFRLYDTYGFPIDLTQLIAAERGYGVDLDGFERALGVQRRRSQAARAPVDEFTPADDESRAGLERRPPAVRRSRGEGWVTVTPRRRQRWVGYDTTRSETSILKYRRVGEQLELVLHENPFYAPGGGQVADTGAVEGAGWRLEVSNVHKVDGRCAVVGSYGLADFEPSAVVAAVDESRRENIERNHTATHLVHAALRKVLGTHARQAGSVVAPDRLRFDFTHHGPLGEGELKAIEEEVNAHIWQNLPIETRQMGYAEAIQAGAMALFGEKYGDRVRVVDIPEVSLELCGGTHVERTGQIGLFRFTHETGVAAGVRRIEAVTGPGAYAAIRRTESWLREAAGVLRAQPDQLARRVEALLEEQRRLERQVEDLLRSGGALGQAAERKQAGDVTIVVDDAPVDDRQQVALLMDAFRARNRRAVNVLFTSGERAGVHVGVTDDLVAEGHRAGDLVNAIAAVSGGKGGGRPHFASAGVGDPDRLPEARQRAAAIVAELVAR